MITHFLPSISNTAGDLNDGSILGSVNQSNPTAVLMGESLVTVSQVLVKDVTATGFTLTDVTTAATNATAGDFNPFGTQPTMSLGDAFYFRTLNNVDTHTFYAQIATAGVGTWTMAVQEYNTTTDTWETVAGLVDNSNGFRAGVGVYKISYTGGAEGLVRLDDTSPKYIWHKVVLTAFTSATTVGANATTTTSGNGGNGTANSISGASITYAGGGGGGCYLETVGSGGTGGGGTGGKSGVASTAGTANTGGGGGGGGSNTTPSAGGSGVVIIAYKTDGTDGVSTSSTGGTITTSGAYTIHTFTTSGTWTMVVAGASNNGAGFFGMLNR